jgi:hypothetical protein
LGQSLKTCTFRSCKEEKDSLPRIIGLNEFPLVVDRGGPFLHFFGHVDVVLVAAPNNIELRILTKSGQLLFRYILKIKLDVFLDGLASNRPGYSLSLSVDPAAHRDHACGGDHLIGVRIFQQQLLLADALSL